MTKQVQVSRTFDAPVTDVWKIWTDPGLVMQWWGPDRFTCPRAEIDFREGGTSLVCMRSPKEFGGQDMYSIWTYKKIIPFQSIEFVQNLADESGKKQNPGSLGMPPDFPEDVRTLVTFEDRGDNKTEMTVTEFADFGQITEFAKLGLEQCFGKMEVIFKKAAS